MTVRYVWEGPVLLTYPLSRNRLSTSNIIELHLLSQENDTHSKYHAHATCAQWRCIKTHRLHSKDQTLSLQELLTIEEGGPPAAQASLRLFDPVDSCLSNFLAIHIIVHRHDYESDIRRKIISIDNKEQSYVRLHDMKHSLR